MSNPLFKYTKFDIRDEDHAMEIIKNKGWLPDVPVNTRDPKRHRLDPEDTIYSTELGPWVKSSIVEMIMEPMQAQLTLSPLMEKISAPEGTTEFRFPGLSAIRVHKHVEGQGYAEDRIMGGGGMMTAAVDRWGAAFSITKDALAKCSWDIVSYYATQVGLAFARQQETEVASHITSLGQPAFDNSSPTLSFYGTTTGRGQTLEANGTLTTDDLFDAYALLVRRGFTPDTLICHPLTYMNFIKDPNLRAFAFQNGGGSVFGNFSGSALNTRQVPDMLKAAYGKGYANAGGQVGVNGTTPTMNDHNFNAITAAPQLPSLFPFSLQIVTSRFMPFDFTNKTTDIVLCERASLGAILDGGPVRHAAWENVEFDLYKQKWEKSWGLIRWHEGLGSVTIKNVVCDVNYVTMEPGRPTYDPTAITEIDRSVAIV